MATAGTDDLTERFIQFYRNYYREQIGQLAQRYPNEQRSLYVDYDDLYTFDPDLAEDYLAKPEQFREYAEEALRLYDLPADVSLGQAHVRVENLPRSKTIDIRGIRVQDDHIGRMIAVQGIVRKATDVRPKITEAAFECQRCGTMTYIPQSDSGFQEPHECQGCERQGPFRVNHDQSEFIDSQKLRVQESPEGLRGGETPQAIDVDVEDDITGRVTPGDHVTVVGVLHIEQMTDGNEKTPVFDLYMEGVSISIEDEEFEDMDITQDDVQNIIERSSEDDIYQQMVDSVAPSIYGYEQEKLAMILQLFSGVTKHLPDGSRIRGDLHMLLIGDPGTGKCVAGDTMVTLADGRRVPIRELVEDNLDDPTPVDDGVYDSVDIDVPSLLPNGTIGSARATRVWKRESSDRMYRIRTDSGRELEVTSSHPLFVDVGDAFRPIEAENLTDGQVIAAAPETDGPIGPIRDEDSLTIATTDGGTVDGQGNRPSTSPAENEIGRDRITSIEPVDTGDEWVYDLEIEGTHNYLSNGIVSHNSQLLSYIQNIAPRSVYTSGKGSSSAGLCVTGDTTIHTAEGFVPIRELAAEHHPTPVDADTASESEHEVYSFDRGSGEIELRESSHVWRMPEKPCRRIETAHGKELEASVNTPVLVCDERGLEWREISEIDAGDHVAVPEYDDVDRFSPPVREFFASAREKLEPTEEVLAGYDSDPLQTVSRETAEASLVWDEVVSAADTGQKEVFDLTVPETHNFVGNGIVTHNTAAAVRDDFGDGQQWTLEAGALVLADKGIAAVDELDKMRCVTGDTRVRLGDGETVPIREMAANATETGTIEELSNGRTIRDIEFTAWTMDERGRIVRRPVTAIHEYDAPDSLVRVELGTGESVTATADHPFFVDVEAGRTEKAAGELDCGDRVYVPRDGRDGSPAATDGGVGSATIPTRSRRDVTTRRVAEVETIDTVTDEKREPKVYDLTVDGTHNFVANGIVVHNSEDRSAMHEALEQQSYHPGSEILLADGRRVEIGEFVDEKMSESPDRVVDGVDCEILPVDGVSVHSTDLETNETRKVPVDRVSRHEAPEEFVRVTFSNGRSVTVTPEHPMFVSRDGETKTVPACDVDVDEFVPAPRQLPNSAAAVELAEEPHVGKEKDVTLPDEMSPKLAEFLGFLVAEGHSYVGRTHEIGFSNQDQRLLDRFGKLVDDLFGMLTADHTNAAGTITMSLISTKLYRWFESNFPELLNTARDKRIPAKVLAASQEEIRRFLVGAFAGDGGVESEAMSFSTASPGLAEDYADALSKIGVASRIHHDTAEDSWKVYVMGDSVGRFVDAVVETEDHRYDQARAFVDRSEATRRHHDVVPTSAAEEIRSLRRLLGLRLTGRFKPILDNGYGIQTETLQTEIQTLRERIATIEAELSEAEDIGSARSAVGWSGRQLAERVDGVTTSSIHYAENGGYSKERRQDIFDGAKRAIEDAIAEAERRIEELQDGSDLRYYRITDVERISNEGENACDWVYDVTVEPTNTFVSKGVVLHNSISISKAGINATLKSRCSLLGAANPKYGRFDQYEPLGEQIDLEPALISRFDLIFTVTDQPDPDHDARLADHILTTNYAGEMNTQRERLATSEFTEAEVQEATQEVEPLLDAEMLRKYIAYAKRNCFPTMTDEAREAIRGFYVDLRAQGADEDAPVPVTARKLEALVRLSEASARVRLSDTVDSEDAERVIDIVESSLQDIGVDPETGQFDADVIETGTSKSQRDRIKNLKGLIEELEDEFEEGAPIEEVIERADEVGMDPTKAEDEIEKLRRKGEVYEPRQNHLRTT
ncbi:LAGLIDADG family homing endonuclease [Halalkaliarchaeum sp. AArc-GB]|uniref:LAGLIDADG family homing endonuclease n=1 Tax=Halalkaliarchaeum sp. AArc-GB TaxID=3074078 RepID=UPI0028555674|nr:LAGLIDADG family homing endonuclease [Halalkaliarchaeum sp. AArc-GB]MDR5672734.1 LAGLIDADG family homing endonuclease [Halalkaliarchaeum sp. AArc-GB]